MGLTATSAAFAACLLLLGMAVALDRRAYRPGQGNYVMLMIFALAASLLLARHLIAIVL